MISLSCCIIVVVVRYPLFAINIRGQIERRKSDSCNQNDTKVTWCLNLWHPELEIEACVNSDGGVNATAAAVQLGLLDVLELGTNCQKGLPLCLDINTIQPYYERGFVVYIESAPGCTILIFHELNIEGGQNRPQYCCMYSTWYHSAADNSPPRIVRADQVVYAPYGTSAMLRCDFIEYFPVFNTFISWNKVQYMCEVSMFQVCKNNLSHAFTGSATS